MKKNETSKVNETKSSVIGKVVNKDFTMNNPPIHRLHLKEKISKFFIYIIKGF